MHAPEACLFFARAPQDVTEEELTALFSEHGAVEEVSIYRSWCVPTTNQPRRCQQPYDNVQHHPHKLRLRCLQVRCGCSSPIAVLPATHLQAQCSLTLHMRVSLFCSSCSLFLQALRQDLQGLRHSAVQGQGGCQCCAAGLEW